MGEGCLPAPASADTTRGLWNCVACPEARLIPNVLLNACLREETKEHVAANPCAKGQRRQTNVGRAAWQSRGGVAEVVVANPSEDHEQAVTSDWRAGAQPRHVLARLRGALTMQFFPVRPLCSRSPPPGMTAMLPGGCSSRAPQWQRQPSPWRGKVGGQLGRTPWCVYACVCDMAVLCAGPSLTITVKHQPQLDSGGPEQNKQVDSSVHRHA